MRTIDHATLCILFGCRRLARPDRRHGRCVDPTANQNHVLCEPFPGYELGDLQRKAESIAVVRPTGASQMRWNSDANKAWTPEVGSGKLALIYRDDDFEVVRLVAGATLPSKVVIRGLGGTVGSDKHVYDGQPEWQKGREYLVFLRHEDTPTRIGHGESADHRLDRPRRLQKRRLRSVGRRSRIHPE